MIDAVKEAVHMAVGNKQLSAALFWVLGRKEATLQ
jgi:hypothetical protein